MKIRLLLWQVCSAGLLAASFSSAIIPANREPQPRPLAVIFFDLPDLPARIDEPKLYKNEKGFALECAIANRSDEQLLGVRLMMLLVDRSGKVRSRVTWAEAAELAMASIKSFTFHPTIKDEPRDSDQLFLVIDEVIGHETIWKVVVGAEAALREYARGQHNAMPRVRTMANKFDRPLTVLVPRLGRKPE